jgi:hypothetical protein
MHNRWLVIATTAVLGGCTTPVQQSPVIEVSTPGAAIVPSRAPAAASPVSGRRITYDGQGAFVLPDGSTVAADPFGGFILPNGAVARPDGSGGVILPNGTRCSPDGARGYICP